MLQHFCHISDWHGASPHCVSERVHLGYQIEYKSSNNQCIEIQGALLASLRLLWIYVWFFMSPHFVKLLSHFWLPWWFSPLAVSLDVCRHVFIQVIRCCETFVTFLTCLGLLPTVCLNVCIQVVRLNADILTTCALINNSCKYVFVKINYHTSHVEFYHGIVWWHA